MVSFDNLDAVKNGFANNPNRKIQLKVFHFNRDLCFNEQKKINKIKQRVEECIKKLKSNYH